MKRNLQTQLVSLLFKMTTGIAMEVSLEFLKLCDEIVEDGELSNNEIYSLAKWINNNPEGRKLWPAKVFVKLLQRVFEDNHISKKEARAVGEIIQNVRRQWARESAPDVESDAAEDVTHEVLSVNWDPAIAKLPLINFQCKVQSSGMDHEYDVDLSEPSCSCPDFKGMRGRLPVGHLSRCCKHIFSAFARVRPTGGSWPGWLDPYLELAFRPHPEQEWGVAEVGDNFALISSAPNEWANVYLIEDGDCQKFGYSTYEDRWSYGTEPESAELFIKAINNLGKN